MVTQCDFGNTVVTKNFSPMMPSQWSRFSFNKSIGNFIIEISLRAFPLSIERVCSLCFDNEDLSDWIVNEDGPRGCDACGSAMRRHASYPNYAHLSNRDYHNTGALQIINYFTSALRAGIKEDLGYLRPDCRWDRLVLPACSEWPAPSWNFRPPHRPGMVWLRLWCSWPRWGA